MRALRKNHRVAEGSHWRYLQDRARRSSLFRGYKMQEQKVSTSTGKRPDYFGISKDDPRQRIVGEVKNVKVLNKHHVDQTRSYKSHPFYAQKGVIVTRRTTVIRDDVRDYAKESNIKIVQMYAKRQNSGVDLFTQIGRMFGL